MSFYLAEFNGLGLLNQEINCIQDDVSNFKPRSYDRLVEERKLEDEAAKVDDKPYTSKQMTDYEKLLDAFANHLDTKELTMENAKLDTLTKKIMIIEKALSQLDNEYNENYNELVGSISSLNVDDKTELVRLYYLNQCMVAFQELNDRLIDKKINRPV